MRARFYRGCDRCDSLDLLVVLFRAQSVALRKRPSWLAGSGSVPSVGEILDVIKEVQTSHPFICARGG